MDVIEIDPGLTLLAEKYFGLKKNERLKIFHEDARTYLNKAGTQYDVIFGDAYKSLMAIPFQLTTLEAAQKKYDLLVRDGILMENIVASMEGPASYFLHAEIRTLKEIFPQVYVFACHNPDDRELLQSISLVAIKSDKAAPFINDDAVLQSYLNSRVDIIIPDNTPILTDDFAPVEYFAMKAL
jgi:spermidine synthase